MDCSEGRICKVQSEGVDPVNRQRTRIQSVCALLAINAITGSATKDARLNPRLIDFTETTYCRCNATYTSEGCCGSNNGMIWEAPQMNLAA